MVHLLDDGYLVGLAPVGLGLRRADRTAYAPSRDRRDSHPLSIGARMMVRVSERAFLTEPEEETS